MAIVKNLKEISLFFLTFGLLKYRDITETNG